MTRAARRLARAAAAAAALLGPAASPLDAQAAPGTPPLLPAPPVVIGHRGASGHAPEHTFAAYDLALAQGADYIEQDLQLTRDGVLVVLHDATLDRTARGPAAACTGRVIERTLAELRQCDVGRWFNEAQPERARPEYVGLRIPTLDEVLARYGRRVRYYVETKTPEEAPGMEAALLRLLARHGLAGAEVAGRRQVLVQSFSAASLQRLHALDPTLPLVQLVGGGPGVADSLQRALPAIAGYAVGIGPARGLVSAALVAAAHRHCLVVHPYTVNEPAAMRALLAAGVDGMFTDRPDRLAPLAAAARAGGAARAPDPAGCPPAAGASGRSGSAAGSTGSVPGR